MSTTPSLQQLYRDTVLTHSRQPRNFRRLDEPDRTAEGHNLLCGDRLSVYLRLRDGTITDIGFEGSGCAITMASASMMTDNVKGSSLEAADRTVREVLQAFAPMAGAAPQDGGGDSGTAAVLPGELTALGGVRAYPSRIRCATLPWQTLQAALDQRSGTVSTE